MSHPGAITVLGYEGLGMDENAGAASGPVDSAACYRLWREMAELGFRLALSTSTDDPAEREAARVRLGLDIALDNRSRDEALARMLAVTARAERGR